MAERITVTEKQLKSAILVWLKKLTRQLWERLIEQKILSFYKRQSGLFDLDSEIAAHIASEMTRHDWQVTHPATIHPGIPRRPDRSVADPEEPEAG